MKFRTMLYGAALAALVYPIATTVSALPLNISANSAAVEGIESIQYAATVKKKRKKMARRAGNVNRGNVNRGNVNRNVNVNRNHNVNRNVNRNVNVNRGVVAVRPVVVRPWVRRAYYGTIVAGVALGTVIAVSAVPVAPAPNLCWYWADPSNTRGYWDYCVPR